MNDKHVKLLANGLVFLSFATSASCFAVTGSVSEEVPSYLDQQNATEVSQNSLLADTSSQSYTDEYSDPFTSFYVAAGINYVKTKVDLDFAFTGIPKQSTSDSKNNFGANINIGYGANLHNFYLGGEGFFNYVGKNTVNNSGLKDFDFGAAMKFGYIFTHNFMVYLLGGVDVAQFDDGVAGKNSTKLGLMPGIGMEYLFNDNWGLRTQYTYTIFPKVSNSDQVSSWDYKVKRSNFGLDLVYRFNY